MFRWTSGLRRTPKEAPASTGGRAVYAVGDVHGCADLLAELVDTILEDREKARFPEQPALVFIGDYVDRGEDSRGVIDQVMELQRSGWFEVRALKGNHEETMLAFLEDPAVGPAWADFGGLATLASYGVSPPTRRSDAEAWAQARDALGKALPRDHLDFFSRLELTAGFGDYYFVHAGVRPGIPLEEQKEHDLLWIREDFLRSRAPLPKVIVYGHTPAPDPQLGPRRIGIDTGAYATGVLTAVRLRDAEREVFQARGGRATGEASQLGEASGVVTSS